MRAAAPGRVTRVNGSLVEVADLPDLSMHDIVEIGRDRLPSEVVAIRGPAVTLQAYEYTGGLAPGDPARGRGEPLSAQLGPHLLGAVFDGLLRPLGDAGPWLDPARSRPPAEGREFAFTPEASDGDVVRGGDCLGAVANPGQVAVPRPGAARRQRDGRAAAQAGPGQRGRGDRGRGRHRRPANQHRGRCGWCARTGSGCQATPRCGPGSGWSTCCSRSAGAGRAAVPGGFGTGKTVLLQQITKWCDADVIVYVGCGERGNELADMLERARPGSAIRGPAACWPIARW